MLARDALECALRLLDGVFCDRLLDLRRGVRVRNASITAHEEHDDVVDELARSLSVVPALKCVSQV